MYKDTVKWKRTDLMFKSLYLKLMMLNLISKKCLGTTRKANGKEKETPIQRERIRQLRLMVQLQKLKDTRRWSIKLKQGVTNATRLVTLQENVLRLGYFFLNMTILLM